MTADLLLKIVLSILAIVSALVTGLLIPYLKTKLDGKKRENIGTLVTHAVMAAEQIYKGSGQGKTKKHYVLSYLQEKGIKMSMDDLDVLIEAHET